MFHRASVSRSMMTLSIGLLIWTGCGGSKPPVGSLETAFQACERDLARMSPSAEVEREAAEGRGKHDRAVKLLGQDKTSDAFGLLDEAVADLRAALAGAESVIASKRAAECRADLERSRRAYDAAQLLLAQAERISGRPLTLPTEPPSPPSRTSGAALDLTNPPSLEEIEAAWIVETDAASARQLAAADLVARYDERRQVLGDPKTKSEDRPRHLHVAARTVQELQRRVLVADASNDCAVAADQAAWYAEHAQQALQATLEIERTMKEDLRAELEKTRAEAKSRQTELYDSLHQLEGKFASIRREAGRTIVSLADILFDFDKATLRREVEFNLVKIATILNQFPEMKVTVEGHTDNVGKDEYNLDLSERRAQAVSVFLASQDLVSERMTVVGYGMTRPVADNATDEGRQKNRRVDLVIEE